MKKPIIIPVLNIFRILTTLEEYIIAIGGVVEGMALDIELHTLKSLYLSEIRNIVANTYRWGYLYSCSTTPCQKNTLLWSIYEGIKCNK